MLLTIHDANLQKVAFIDNDKQTTLNYYDDTWTRNLETGSSTFEFTVFKKAIQSDTAIHKTYNYINEKAFVSFKYNGKSYVFSVMIVEEDEQTIKCYCENLNLELINEYANPYKSTKAMSFVDYCNAMDLLNFTHLSVGINEISDQKRTLEWEGQDTKLARLLSLATKFDAEIDFDTYLNADSTIKAFKVNVYHEYDDNHQGVGRVRNDIQLTYGKNLKSIKRKVDKTGLYTMVRPYGKKTEGEAEKIISIGSLAAWSENNADGVREFYQNGDALYAPLAAQMYPSTFTSGTQVDQWIKKDLEVDSENPTVIRAAGIANLRKNAYPSITYDVDGFLDVEVGDTVKIYDDGFSPILLVEARVSDQKISFTNPASNKTTFSNFKALENKLSDGIQAAFERLFEASKPYLIKLSTDNGVIFKNGQGQSIITPTLYRGGKPISTDVTWRWTVGETISTGMTHTVNASSVVDTLTIKIAAYIIDDEVATAELTFTNVNDGLTYYPHVAYANSADGRTDFSLTDSTGRRYQGTYHDTNQSGSTDPTKYKWVDMVGTVEIGIRNLIKGTKDLSGNFNKSLNTSDTYLCFNIAKSKPSTGYADTFRAATTINATSTSYVATFFAKSDIEGVLVDCHLFSPNTTTSAESSTGHKTTAVDGLVNVRLSTKWQRYWVKWTQTPTSNIKNFIVGRNHFVRGNATVEIAGIALYEGNMPKDWQAAPEDINDLIDSKADQVLTQEQLNALAEKAQVHEAELQAKASMEAFSDLEKVYKTFVAANAEASKQAEADLIEAGRRIELLTTQFGGFKELKTFIDTYMSSSNEGLIIGKNDASSTIKVSSDRISMFSAGKEVMYISQGVIHIDNGIFTVSIQIGRFRTEQYHLNLDMNVIRYVG